MVVVINLASPEAQAKNLAAFVAKLSGGAGGEPDAAKLESLNKVVDSGKFVDVITALTAEIPEVFKSEDNADIDGFFVEILAIVGTLGEEEQKKVAEALISQITAQKDTKPLVRLRILSKLYNFFASNSASRFDIFRSLLEYSKDDSVLAGAVQPSLANVDQRLAEWNATTEQKRVTYQLVHEVHEKTGSATLSYQSLLSLLATYEEGDAAGAKDAAARAVVLAVSLPGNQDYSSLLALNAVKQLESGDNAALYTLLSTFVSGDLAKFEATASKDKATFEKHNLDTDAGLKKIRVTSFAALAAKNSNLTFSGIASALNLKEDQVEDWIIGAVASDSLEAKIDQINAKVFVERCPQQIFAKDHWATMKTKVTNWQDSIKRMLAVLDQADSS